MKYIALEPVWIGDSRLMPGEVFDPIDNRDWVFLIEQNIIAENVISTENKLTEATENDIVDKAYSITKSGAWFKIVDASGKQFGKATKDEDEANEILSEANAS